MPFFLPSIFPSTSNFDVCFVFTNGFNQINYSLLLIMYLFNIMKEKKKENERQCLEGIVFISALYSSVAIATPPSVVTTQNASGDSQTSPGVQIQPLLPTHGKHTSGFSHHRFILPLAEFHVIGIRWYAFCLINLLSLSVDLFIRLLDCC